MKQDNSDSEESFEDLGHPTLEQIEKKRLKKIKYTPIGPIINGKQVGFRHLKQYYKQYLGRDYPETKIHQNAIENGNPN